MKRYTGDRTIDGIEVLVDGEPLDERLDIQAFSDNGFEWTYGGDAPLQLALAILADHLGDNVTEAVKHCDVFMKNVIAKLDNTWELTSADVDAALEKIGA